MKWLGLDSWTIVFFLGFGSLTTTLYLRGVDIVWAIIASACGALFKEGVIDNLAKKCRFIERYGGDPRGGSFEDVFAAFCGIAIAWLVIVA